jgi:hypothetical protein
MSFGDSLAEFWEFVASYRTFPAWIAKAAVAGPMINIITGLGPPWPAVRGVSLCTAVVEIVVLMAVFQFFVNHPVPRKRLERSLLAVGVVIALAFFLYLGLFKFMTFHDDDASRWRAKGFRERTELVDAIGTPAAKPADVGSLDLRNVITKSTSEETLIKLAGYDARLIWEGWTVDAVEYALLANWLLFFGTLAAYVALFVILQRNEAEKKSEKPGDRKKTGRGKSSAPQREPETAPPEEKAAGASRRDEPLGQAP